MLGQHQRLTLCSLNNFRHDWAAESLKRLFSCLFLYIDMMKKILNLLLLGLLVLGCATPDDTVLNNGGGNDDNKDDEFVSSASLYGEVLDNYGEPIEGVLVSDGAQTVVTDEKGRYEIYTDLSRCTFAFVTVPAEYEVVSKGGLPVDFYKRIPAGSKQFQADFMLKRRTAPGDRYTVLIAADPQIRQKNAGTDKYLYHVRDVFDEMCADMRAFSATITDRPVYGMTLGDMVHDDMTGTHDGGTLWQHYLAGISGFTFPVFHVIGNHEHPNTAASEAEGSSYYENNIGPLNYAMDLGKIHYIFLDNMMAYPSLTKSAEYKNGISDEVFEWLRGHLAHVSKDKILMVSCHSSIYRKISGQNSDKNHENARNLFSQYKAVHTWAGHNHDYYNYVYRAVPGETQYPNAESHVIGRTTGTLGINAEVTCDGAWRGYLVMDVDGEDIKWKFHPFMSQYFDKNFFATREEFAARMARGGGQFRATAPNENGWTSDGKVHVNVWMYDDLWGPVYYTDSGKNKVEMTREKAQDGYAKYLHDKWNARYSSVGITTRDYMFSITPSEGATSCKIEVTDRFGQTWTDELSW